MKDEAPISRPETIAPRRKRSSASELRTRDREALIRKIDEALSAPKTARMAIRLETAKRSGIKRWKPGRWPR